MIKVELKVDNNNKDPALTKEKEHNRIGLENYECVCVCYIPGFSAELGQTLSLTLECRH